MDSEHQINSYEKSANKISTYNPLKNIEHKITYPNTFLKGRVKRDQMAKVNRIGRKVKTKKKESAHWKKPYATNFSI